MTTVEPPADGGLFGDGNIQPASGEFNRDFWTETAVNVHGLDEDVASERPTGWIVAWARERKNKYYDTESENQ